MLRLITRRRSVTNSLPALLASTAPGVSAPLIGEPTPLTEATLMTSQSKQMRAQGEEMKAYAGHMRDLVRAIQMFDLQISLPVLDLATPSTSEPLHPADAQ
ncbi:hypothetical protein ACFX19_022860 [Malus domestica]